MIKYKKDKGFTLIELMVVISIIGLLSSIVLASIKNVRDKSLGTKFRSEMQQFIYALELYKNDNQEYPHQGGEFGQNHSTMTSNSNVISRSFSALSDANNVPLLSMLVSPYLKTLPSVPQNSYNQSQIAWFYEAIAPGHGPKRCIGDSIIPPYVITISNQNPLLFSTFSDWPHSQTLNTGNGTWSAPNTTVRCFSIK